MHGLDRYKHLKPFPHFGVVLYIIFPGDFIIVWFNSHISRQWHSRDSINYRRYHPTLNTRGGVKNLYLAIKIPRHWTKLRTYILQDEENKGFIKNIKRFRLTGVNLLQGRDRPDIRLDFMFCNRPDIWPTGYPGIGPDNCSGIRPNYNFSIRLSVKPVFGPVQRPDICPIWYTVHALFVNNFQAVNFN